MAINIGDSLSKPSEGYKRFYAIYFTSKITSPDNHEDVIWKTSTNASSGYYRYYISCTAEQSLKGASMEFSFIGSKIVLMSQATTSRATKVKITIDDTDYGTYSSAFTSSRNCYVFYANENLSYGEHTIKLTVLDEVGEGRALYIDAIDTDGYIIHSLGNTLSTPYTNWVRYDNSNDNIILDNFGYTSSSASHWLSYASYPKTVGATCTFSFYGSQFLIIGTTGTTRTNSNVVEIDGQPAGTLTCQASATAYIAILYKSEKLEEGLHTVKITTDVAGASTGLNIDAIDIDGCIVTNDGFHDISKSIVLSEASSQRSSSYNVSKLFDGGTPPTGGACWSSLTSDIEPWIKVDFGKKTSITQVNLYSGYYPAQFPAHVSVYGSKDDNIYRLLTKKELNTSIEAYKPDSVLINSAYRYYKLVFKRQSESSYVSIGEIMFLSDNIKSSYLILEEGGTIKTFSLDGELSSIDITPSKENIEKYGFNDLSTIVDNLHLLPNKFKILSSDANKVNVEGLKNKSELIVATKSFITKIASRIERFKLYHSVTGNSHIKLAVSSDNGATWLTYTDGEWENLDITIPNKDYNSFDTSDFTNWNKAKETILAKGIPANSIESLDFNQFHSQIKFAYALYREDINDECSNTNLEWVFDSKGKMRQMTPLEYVCDVYDNCIEVTPQIENEMIKVNIAWDSKSDNNIFYL